MRDQFHVVFLANQSNRSHISLNISLIELLNPLVPINFDIIDNGFMHNPKLGIYPIPNTNILLGKPQDRSIPDPYINDFQSGEALNTYLSKIPLEARFICILDPSFYITATDWISTVKVYMRNSGLSFFGAPWHPTKYKNYRLFPSPNFLVIDLELVSPDELDFLPDISILSNLDQDKNDSEGISSSISQYRTLMPKLIQSILNRWTALEYKLMVYKNYHKHILARFSPQTIFSWTRLMSVFSLTHTRHFLYFTNFLLFNRRYIASHRGLGYRLYKRFRYTHSYSTLYSALSPDISFPNTHLAYYLGSVLESFLPQSISYLDSLSKFTLIHAPLYPQLFQYSQTLPHRIHEYKLNGAPFAFHINLVTDKKESFDQDLSAIKLFLSSLKIVQDNPNPSKIS